MAVLKHKSRVKQTSITTGTGAYSLDATIPTGFRGFVAAIGDTNYFHGEVTDGTDWEEGVYTVTDATPDTIARTTILDSSNAGAAVSWGAGVKTIVCTPVASLHRPAIHGEIVDYAGVTAPDQWLMCFGQSLLRATYPLLFTAIGTTYGAVDGTHFTLPDCRGRVTAGQDDMGGSSANRLTNAATGGLDGDVLGGTGGEEAHSLTVAEVGSTITNANISASSFRFNGVSPGAAHNVVQPTIILNKIIFAGV